MLQLAWRRLADCEKNRLRPGAVYVFDQEASRIHRWTDGRNWSPSRINGNFLVYREVECKIAWRATRPRKLFEQLWEKASLAMPMQVTLLAGDELDNPTHADGVAEYKDGIRNVGNGAHGHAERGSAVRSTSPQPDSELYTIFPEIRQVEPSRVLNSNKGLYIYRRDGLIKRTISVRIVPPGHGSRPHTWHLVAYQARMDGRLCALGDV
ncbi:gluconate transport inducer 1/Pac2 [Thamnocephalis sphaerospora]|uniref:Gluconate transport inducer 1/Pac2 n=1 Tax=Thamnocephalis sphaerospora TaxID=78915 RepID=A0A4P9XP66_9FUNG|nr:gluconate transport inducer 1/Pac2 [Thamnocephalis sphaerospora]|eukprot:RKP07221.1 gluconate transport inducer 1/Pac2 [Thamnocephalis sphaerospora]